MNDLSAEIQAVRSKMGKDLLILGHLYQRAAVLDRVDFFGDSLDLAKRAASNRTASRIVFCGVRFMAETADILTAEHQAVFMPDVYAGCPMAEMADASAMQEAWDVLTSAGGDWCPVVYVNSSVAVKACCGKLGGSACTSSNAGRIIKRALDSGKKVLFLPDEHLGYNVAMDLGVSPDETAIYDPNEPSGGLDPKNIARARVVVWKGFCIVHTAFTVEDIKKARKAHPDAKIIVHPETPHEVVALCDAHGSTSQIMDYVENLSAGSTVIVGTEINLVQHLAALHRSRITVKALKSSTCANMAKTNLRNLRDLLVSWPDENRIQVDESTARFARLALDKMLSL